MRRITLQFLIGAVLACFPLFAFGQTKGLQAHLEQSYYQGVVRSITLEDERLFANRRNVEDRFDPPLASANIYFLDTVSGSIRLDESVDWLSYVNREISVTGWIYTGNNERVLRVNSQSIKLLHAPLRAEGVVVPPVTQGNLKVLVVGVTVQQQGSNRTAQDFMSLEEALAPVMTNPASAKNFYAEASRVGGQILLTLTGHSNSGGDAAFVTITGNRANCATDRYNAWREAVDVKLREQQIEPNWYNSIVLVYDDGCNLSSAGTGGVIGVLGRRESVYTNKGTWLSVNADFMISHELGHNLGLDHSMGYVCSNPANIPASCTLVDYGDRVCFMGRNYFLPNVYQRRRLGWHDQPFKQLLYSGNYYVYSPSIPGQSGAKRLMSCRFCYIPLSGSLAGYSLYYESRRAYPWDDLIIWHEFYEKGVKLMIGVDDMGFGGRSYILDTTPADGTTYNAPLVLQSYTVGGVQTTHLSITNAVNGSKMSVSLP